MKKRAIWFICLALIILMVVPAVNLARSSDEVIGRKCCDAGFLYNLDFAMPAFSRLLYTFGISVDSDNAIIGKEEWLYLGDRHEKNITVRRRGVGDKDAEIIRKITLATSERSLWLKKKGVKDFRILICPDKNTVYPEFLPAWANPHGVNATDDLLAKAEKNIYIDSRQVLFAAKNRYSEPLFYKADTHWNALGAWLGFQELVGKLGESDAALRWPSVKKIRSRKITNAGGDLANFLRLANTLQDTELVLEMDGSRGPMKTMQSDFLTGTPVASNGLVLQEAPMRPLLVKSAHALNDRRVLWLRDSFGNAMTPYMAETFTETLQLHYDEAHPELFARLVDQYKPDYVLITVVERRARVKWFEKELPE